jgi:hypothetical protein
VLAGCTGESDRAGGQAMPDVLTLLRTEATASLQNAVAKTEKSKSLAFTMEMAVQGQQITSAGELSYGPPLAMSMTMEMPPLGAIESRLVGNAQYVKMPPQLQRVVGKPWIKVDLAQAAEAAGLDLSQFTKQLENCDPAKQIRMLLAGGKLRVVGEETVDGVKTVHYAGTVPLDDYLDQVAPDARAKAKANLDKAGVKEIATELWVDEQYQPRRAELTMGEVDTRITYTDYGKPVNVVVPPAAETMDLAELRKRVPA